MKANLSILGMYNYDPSIFEGLYLPEGLDRGTVISKLLLDLAGLELLYPEPDTMRTGIEVWSKAMRPSWDRMYAALTAEYNPIHNYDRHEEWDDEAGTDAHGENRTEVAGFNQTAGLTDRDKTTQDTNGSSQAHHAGHTYGNIGVTTSMQMITQEVEGRVKMNMTELIISEFKTQFCVMIY